jgi:hypothetical protein
MELSYANGLQTIRPTGTAGRWTEDVAKTDAVTKSNYKNATTEIPACISAKARQTDSLAAGPEDSIEVLPLSLQRHRINLALEQVLLYIHSRMYVNSQHY